MKKCLLFFFGCIVSISIVETGNLGEADLMMFDDKFLSFSINLFVCLFDFGVLLLRRELRRFDMKVRRTDVCNGGSFSVMQQILVNLQDISV